MRIPSQKSFVAAFGEDTGTTAYRLAKGIDKCREHPAVVEWAKQCYHDPRESRNAYAECLMCALDSVLGGYGVEPIHGRHVDTYHGDIQAVYINMGDTYTTTLVLDHELNRISINTMGDWVETHHNREII